MRARHVLAAASIVLLAGGLAVAGQERHGRHGGAFGERLDRISRRLNLTEGQRTRVLEIVRQHRADGLGEAARQARLAHRDLRAVIRDPSADESVIREAAARASRADADLAVERHRAFADALSVLTPEQQEKAKALRAEALKRRPTI